MIDITLNNDVKIPQLGFGVWKIPDEEVEPIVHTALNAGYRSIDTASYYFNEKGIGNAIMNTTIPREQLFITTKVWNIDQGYDKTLKSFEKSMDKLQLDYLDLFLIHWPCPKFDKYIETYKALETLYEAGKVKAIGVCNFHIEHLERVMDECDIVPVVNQVECHPYLQQKELKAFCERHHIYIESWSPLFRGGELLEDETLINIGNQYGKTAAQVVLRWHIQENSIVIPKSSTPSRIKENIDVFDFELSESDMAQISTLDRNERRGDDPHDMHRF